MGPYSPMVDPIEYIWSKLKAAVKRRIAVGSGLGLHNDLSILLARRRDGDFMNEFSRR